MQAFPAMTYTEVRSLTKTEAYNLVRAKVKLTPPLVFKTMSEYLEWKSRQ